MATDNFYNVHVYRELKPRYELVPVYYSPDGKTVSRDEATLRTAEVVCVNRQAPSDTERKQIINQLRNILCYKGDYSKTRRHFEQVTHALEDLASDPKLKLTIGIKVLNDSIRNSEHLNIWDSMEWAVWLLGESGHQEAIEPLMEMCSIDNEGVDHYTSMESTAECARDALEKIISTDHDLAYNIYIRLLRTLYPNVKIWAAGKLAELGNPDAIHELRDVLASEDGYRHTDIKKAVEQALERLCHS